MKIICGVNGLSEAGRLAPYVDELYFGVSFVENHRKWYPRQNLRTLGETAELVSLAHGAGRKVFFAANELYPRASFARDMRNIEKVLALGPDGIIARDINLLGRLKRNGYNGEVCLSSTAICFNSETLDFFSGLGVFSVVLPQHLKAEEWRRVLRERPGTRFEVFFYPDCYCPNMDGLCVYHDVNKTPEPRNCWKPYFLEGKKEFMRKPPIRERYLEFYRMARLGAERVKIARDAGVGEKVRTATFVRELADRIDKGTGPSEFLRSVETDIWNGRKS